MYKARYFCHSSLLVVKKHYVKKKQKNKVSFKKPGHTLLFRKF